MTLDERLVVAMDTLADRVSSFPAPAGTARPYVTYQRIVGQRHATLNSGTGAPKATFQIDVWGLAKGDARLLADRLIDSLPGLLKVGDITDNADDYESDTELHRASFDITVWA